MYYIHFELVKVSRIKKARMCISNCLYFIYNFSLNTKNTLNFLFSYSYFFFFFKFFLVMVLNKN